MSKFVVSASCLLFEFVFYFVRFSCLTFRPFFGNAFVFGVLPSGRRGCGKIKILFGLFESFLFDFFVSDFLQPISVGLVSWLLGCCPFLHQIVHLVCR